VRFGGGTGRAQGVELKPKTKVLTQTRRTFMQPPRDPVSLVLVLLDARLHFLLAAQDRSLAGAAGFPWADREASWLPAF